MARVKTLTAGSPAEARGIRKALRAMGRKFEFKTSTRRNPRRYRGRRIVRRNVEGFLDDSGRFHPIRSSEGYSDKEVGWTTAGAGGVRARKKSRKSKKNGRRRTVRRNTRRRSSR